jgi:uncharacterized protein (TIGR00730 family)
MSEPSTRIPEDWPLKAYKNLDFLNSDAAREIRVLCEMTEPRLRFREEKIEDTIVLFGSARIRPPEVAKKALRDLEAELKDPDAPSPAEARALRQARSGVRSAAYYDAAVALAERLTRWSMELEDHGRRFVVCSGGGPGIMEAANKGARQAGGKSVGLGISLPMEQGINEHVTETLSFEFHYFFVRKYWFVCLAKALVAFPGGFGTLDELFETLTLVQTGKTGHRPPVVLFGADFWNGVVDFDALLEWGTIGEDDFKLFRVVDSVDEAFDYITAELTRRYLDGPGGPHG